MKELVIVSGKGGTGKTSIVAAFGSLCEKKVLCDADVDAADLHLIVAPEILERHEFKGGRTAIIDLKKCTACGLCRDLCRWKAITEDFRVDPIDCEGCGVCWYFCPEAAIDSPHKVSGEWFISRTRFGPLVHAALHIGEENSGKLVALVRQEAGNLAVAHGLDMVLTDGPPGIGCPVIASVGGASALLIVTEPTVAGKHDMERVAQLAAHFRVPAMVCVNKWDLNPGVTEAIEKWSVDKGLTVVGRVPFDPVFTKAMVRGRTVFEHDGSSEAAGAVRAIWARAMEVLNG
jgi:MinD superfamily P-loop ATPase